MIWGVRSGQKVDFFSDQDKGSILFFGTQNLAAANLWMRISRSSEGVGKKTGYLDMATQRVLSCKLVFIWIQAK